MSSHTHHIYVYPFVERGFDVTKDYLITRTTQTLNILFFEARFSIEASVRHGQSKINVFLQDFMYCFKFVVGIAYLHFIGLFIQ